MKYSELKPGDVFFTDEVHSSIWLVLSCELIGPYGDDRELVMYRLDAGHVKMSWTVESNQLVSPRVLRSETT